MFFVAFSYLAFPVFIILFSFFSYPLVISSAIALITIILCLHKSHQQGGDRQLKPLIKYWPLLLVSLVVTYACTALPLGECNWERTYAIFNLLMERSWPPVLILDEQMWFIRYYLAWYVVPTLFAKILGPQFLEPTLFVYTFTGLFIVLILAFHNFHKVRHLFAASLIFLFFSGLDLIGAWLTNNIEPLNQYWLSGWAKGKVFAIFSNITSFQVAPHQAMGGFITTCLFLYHRQLAVRYGAVIIIVSTLWTPFATIGLLPIALWALLKEGYKTSFTLQNLVAAPLLLVPIFLYLTQETGKIPFMFTYNDKNFYFTTLIMFYLLEFIVIQVVLYKNLTEKKGLVAILAIFLCTLCLFKIGEYNDLVRRGTIPAICAMSILMFQVILRSKGWRRGTFSSLYDYWSFSSCSSPGQEHKSIFSKNRS